MTFFDTIDELEHEIIVEIEKGGIMANDLNAAKNHPSCKSQDRTNQRFIFQPCGIFTVCFCNQMSWCWNED